MKLKNFFIFYAILLPFSVLIRVFHLNMIDPATGFIDPDYAVQDGIVLFCFFAISLFFIIFVRFGSIWPKEISSPSVFMGIVSLLMAAALFIYFITETMSTTIVTGGKVNTVNLIYVITILGSSFYFIWQAFAYFKLVRFATVLTLFPILWAAIRLALTFIAYNGISKISENLFDVEMLSLTLLFWLMHGKAFSGISFRKTVKWLYGIGFAASLTSIICTVPRYIIKYTIGPDRLHQTSTPKFIDVVIAVYIIIFLAVTYFKSSSRHHERNKHEILISMPGSSDVRSEPKNSEEE